MNKITNDKIKLQAIITLDEISESSVDRLLQQNNSFLRNAENKISNEIEDHAESVLSNPEPEAITHYNENVTAAILDITSEMNRSCFKTGLQTGASLMLELLNIL